jgi:tetratricopeptide (TPR) repeat protein
MFRSKTPNPQKALSYEKKGDKLLEKGKTRKALIQYQKSEALDPERPEIYQKLVDTLNQLEDSWSEQDFSNSMAWTMRQQELQNPAIILEYQKLSPEYSEVQKLVQRLLLEPEEAMETQLIQEILAYGEKAPLPLLHFLISLKKSSKQEA